RARGESGRRHLRYRGSQRQSAGYSAQEVSWPRGTCWLIAVLIAVPALAGRCPARSEALVTGVFCQPDAPYELHYALLSLPEQAVELAFAPLAAVVMVWERYRVVSRISDLLQNDAGTVVFTPGIDVFSSDGFSGGGSLSLISLAGQEERFDLGVVARLNGEVEADFHYEQPLAAVDGRRIQVDLEYLLDLNAPWYGYGQSIASDERALRYRSLVGEVSFDLGRRGVLDLSGMIKASFRRETISGGSDPSIPAAGSDTDVRLPPGFGRTTHFPGVALSFQYDSRDSAGNPTRGIVARIEADVTHDVDGAQLSGLGLGGSFTGFIPVLADKRSLQLTVGGRGTTALNGGHEVPFHQLTVLGRKNHLRGFSRSRFRERHGWWATMEYRYPIYEYLDTGIGGTIGVFVDIGRVGAQLDDLFEHGPRISGGVVLRAAHDTERVFDLGLGFSREGPEIILTVGAL
ncbi:MAG: outer membrane protein assembly factor BamA, partial [Myxococcota bacterium]